MRSVNKKPAIFYSVVLLIVAAFSVSVILQGCKKSDFATGQTEKDFTKNFFTPKNSVTQKVQEAINQLKRENDKRNFVNALPHDLGRPVWEKTLFRKMTNTLAKEDSGDHYIVIPFAPTGTYLRGLLVAVPISDTGYSVTYYSNELLDYVCHDPNKDITKTENLLGIFMVMDNRLFGRTDFYHIPKDLLTTNARVSLTDSTKVASMMQAPSDDCPVTVPSGVHHPGEDGNCDWALGCPWCSGCYYGGNPPFPDPGGGGSPSPPGNPPTPPPTGGGGGGGNCTTCPPPPGECRMPFYVEDPCPITPVPTEPPPVYDPSIADAIQIDTSISNNFPCLDTLLQNLPNANRVAQEMLNSIFGVNIYSNLTFQIDWSLSPTSYVNAYTTPGTPYSFAGFYRYFDTIKINPWMVQRASKEYLVGTLMHEAIHAYIQYRYGQWELGYLSADSFIAEFPLFWPNYTNPLNTSEQMDHEQMAASYIGDLSDIIKLYYNPSAPPALRDRVANSIAWEGLMTSTAWRFPNVDTCRIKRDNIGARNTTMVWTIPATGACPATTVRYDSLGLSLPCK